MRRPPFFHTLATAFLSLAVGLGVPACGSQSEPEPTGKDDTPLTETVQILVPSDGITLSQNTPTNKWGSFAQAITTDLTEKGFPSDNVQVTASQTLEDQSTALEDLETAPDVLIFAPAVSLDAATKQYGDLIGDGAGSLDMSALDSETTDEAERTQNQEQIVKAVDSLRSQGTAVIVVARTFDGLSADAFVQTSTPFDIGKMQATQLATKLEVSEASADKPRTVEIFAPRGTSDGVTADFFKGVWSILGPDFTNGSLVSPSGRIATDSTEKDWESIVIEADTPTQAYASLDAVLDTAGTDDEPAVHLDGILAANDLLASQVTTVLTDRGYHGSAADINPDITIGDIVGNMAGNKDVSKQAVPLPQQNTDSETVDETTDESGYKAYLTQWPIVTGYGSYVTTVKSVVSGKQWLTGLEDRSKLAEATATLCLDFATDASTSFLTTKKVAINGVQVPVIRYPLVAVSGDNLKTALIDTGYISPADAGL